MKKIIFGIVIILIIGCKKEKIEPSDGVSLVGKLKTLYDNNFKFVYSYNDSTGFLNQVYIYSQLDTIDSYTFLRGDNKIYIDNKFEISVNPKGLIQSFKTIELNPQNYISINYTNKLISFTDPINPFFSGGKYYNFIRINGNYTQYLHRYTPFLSGGLNIDTFKLTYTDLPYNKYAPLQKLYFGGAEYIDHLGFDDNFLFPQNKNLIKSLGIFYENTNIIYNFDYEFNSINQLVKVTTIDNNGNNNEYNLEYY
jgi:hypothetical protein